MDVLDLIEVGSRATRGRIRRAVVLAGALLMFGWAQGWPIAHPLVQGALDQRVDQVVDVIVPEE